MAPVEEMTDEQFEKHTLAILARELGPLGMARYLRTHRTDAEDYTGNRDRWLGHLTIDQILEEARKLETEHPDLLRIAADRP
ncbi:MAG: hypothetical protein WCF17_20295 [Terracidiphilus sp.]